MVVGALDESAKIDPANQVGVKNEIPSCCGRLRKTEKHFVQYSLVAFHAATVAPYEYRVGLSLALQAALLGPGL